MVAAAQPRADLPPKTPERISIRFLRRKPDLGKASVVVSLSVLSLWAATTWRQPTVHGLGSHPLLKQGRPIRSVFFIAKSENRNQVHYGIKVDGACRPFGHQPVYGYWRDFEDGPRATSPLLDREQSAYGLTRPFSIKRHSQGGEVLIGLRGFPDRRIRIQAFESEKGCRARAVMSIRKQPSVLSSIYIELGFLFSIDYVLIRGVRIADGRPLSEKVDD